MTEPDLQSVQEVARAVLDIVEPNVRRLRGLAFQVSPDYRYQILEIAENLDALHMLSVIGYPSREASDAD